MQKSKDYSILETATNIAVLLVAFAVLSALCWGYFLHRRPISLKSGLQKGHKLQDISRVDFSNSSKTLLIAMSTKCSFCTESISFYNQLAKLQQKTNQSTRIVAIFPEERITVDYYAQQNKIDAGIITIADADLKSVNVDSTPTIILIDSNRTILDFWIGKLSESLQQEVTQAFTQHTV